MNHATARLLIGAEPNHVPPELAEHLATCPECAQFQRETLALETNIRRALEPGPLAAPVRKAAPPVRATVWSGWALAASVAVASVLAIWALSPTASLARDIVTHVEYEPGSWTGQEPATEADVTNTLAQAGVALQADRDKVVYARSCLFRGRLVPHLVVVTAQGPVTVLILTHESVTKRTDFHEDGMSGVITPAPKGSVAVLARGNKNIDAVAQELQQAVRWN